MNLRLLTFPDPTEFLFWVLVCEIYRRHSCEFRLILKINPTHCIHPLFFIITFFFNFFLLQRTFLLNCLILLNIKTTLIKRLIRLLFLNLRPSVRFFKVLFRQKVNRHSFWFFSFLLRASQSYYIFVERNKFEVPDLLVISLFSLDIDVDMRFKTVAVIHAVLIVLKFFAF